MLRFSPFMSAAKTGLCIILILFVSELAVLAHHLGEGAEHISGSILNGISVDKSQYVSSLNLARHNMLTSNKRAIYFTVRITNHTGTDIQAGNVSLAFQNHGRYIADPTTMTFDLANGDSKLITISWRPSILLDSSLCTVITTVYDAADDQLGSLDEDFVLN